MVILHLGQIRKYSISFCGRSNIVVGVHVVVRPLSGGSLGWTRVASTDSHMGVVVTR